jgi:hypothetical protein
VSVVPQRRNSRISGGPPQVADLPAPHRSTRRKPRRPSSTREVSGSDQAGAQSGCADVYAPGRRENAFVDAQWAGQARPPVAGEVGGRGRADPVPPPSAGLIAEQSWGPDRHRSRRRGSGSEASATEVRRPPGGYEWTHDRNPVPSPERVLSGPPVRSPVHAGIRRNALTLGQPPSEGLKLSKPCSYRPLLYGHSTRAPDADLGNSK